MMGEDLRKEWLERDEAWREACRKQRAAWDDYIRVVHLKMQASVDVTRAQEKYRASVKDPPEAMRFYREDDEPKRG